MDCKQCSNGGSDGRTKLTLVGIRGPRSTKHFIREAFTYDVNAGSTARAVRVPRGWGLDAPLTNPILRTGFENTWSRGAVKNKAGAEDSHEMETPAAALTGASCMHYNTPYNMRGCVCDC